MANWYKIAQRIKAYHGTQADFNTWGTSFVGEGDDAEGPGLYFTNDPDDASGYAGDGDNGIGGKVFPVYLDINKSVPLSGPIPQEEIKQLLLWSIGLNSEEDLYNIDENKFWDSALSNWGEDPVDGFYQAFNAIMDSDNPHDAFQQIWYDFYRYEPEKYVNNMVKLGYDGVIVPKYEAIHYIIFNPNIITPVFSEQNNNLEEI